MLSQYNGWMREHWDAEHQMFQWDGLHDGMEVGIDAMRHCARSPAAGSSAGLAR